MIALGMWIASQVKPTPADGHWLQSAGVTLRLHKCERALEDEGPEAPYSPAKDIRAMQIMKEAEALAKTSGDEGSECAVSVSESERNVLHRAASDSRSEASRCCLSVK